MNKQLVHQSIIFSYKHCFAHSLLLVIVSVIIAVCPGVVLLSYNCPTFPLLLYDIENIVS